MSSAVSSIWLRFVTYFRYTNKKVLGWYLLTLISAILAMFSKPMAVTIPLILILIDLLVPRNNHLQKFSFRGLIIDKIPFSCFLLESV